MASTDAVAAIAFATMRYTANLTALRIAKTRGRAPILVDVERALGRMRPITLGAPPQKTGAREPAHPTFERVRALGVSGGARRIGASRY
jgi:hypothetical protein